jgi:hypothetical protein
VKTVEAEMPADVSFLAMPLTLRARFGREIGVLQNAGNSIPDTMEKVVSGR